MATTSNSNEPFAFGDGTLMQLREQHWDFDELGTIVAPPVREPRAVQAVEPLVAVPVEIGEETKLLPIAVAPLAGETAGERVDETVEAAPAVTDPLARIEQRLEELTRAVLSMQRRLDSIDQAMARFLTR